MCLTTITQRIEKPSKKATKAWKWFRKNSEGKLELPYFYFIHPIPIIEGKWTKAIEQKLYSATGEEYTSGFHCYTNKEQAENYHRNDSTAVLIEVKVKEITTYGTQYLINICDVLVAKQILIPKSIK